jgi:hypothetical protein
MRVLIGWSYYGGGFDLSRLFLKGKLLARDTASDRLRFDLPGNSIKTGKEDIWNGKFEFGPDLDDVTGWVHGLQRFGDGIKTDFIGGLKLPYAEVVKVVRTSTKKDNLAMFAKAFRGNDIIDTTYFRDRGANDKLEGFAGKDQLIAGQGADRLYGGSGADRFVYKSIADSTTTFSGQDVVFDFSSKQRDKIDLARIDANTITDGNQSFFFIGYSAFTKAAGELRFSTTSSGLVVEGDVNGDGISDFAISMKGVAALAASDFLL